MEEKKRENWIDVVKLIAILIVVMNHTGLTVPFVSFWGGMFFVPVFFVLSGYTYRDRGEETAAVMRRKAGRLLLPYFAANLFLTAFFFCKDVLAAHTKTAGDMKTGIFGIFYARNQIFTFDHETLYLPAKQVNYFLMPNLNSPTWFLPALFMTFFLFACSLRIARRDLKNLWFIASLLLLVGIVYHYVSPILLMWSLDAIPFFYIFFLIGYTMRVNGGMEWFDRHLWLPILLLAGLIACGICNGSANFSIGQYGRSVVLSLYNGAASSVLLMYLCLHIRRFLPDFLAAAGRQTLFILCYHLFVLAILEAAMPSCPVFVRVLLAIALLAAVSMAKDRIGNSWKQRREKHAKKSGD